MSIFQAPLPDYDSPPVGEVALSVQFETLKTLQAAHFGLLWTRLRERYPTTQTQGPIEPVVEMFGPKLGAPTIRLEVVNEPMPPRVWFLSATGNELVQVQRDRFIFNWRRLKTTDVYPRYKHIRERFLAELRVFSEFLEAESLGELKPNQCEVTYINQIASGAVWASHGEIGNVLAPWRTDFPDASLPECESVRLALRYLILDPKNPTGSPAGRLHVDVQPAVRVEDQAPIFAMNLTARGAPLGRGSDGVAAFLDLGRRYIVVSFTALTTKEMHKQWGLHE